MVAVEHRLCCGQIALQLRLPAPWQAQQHVEIVADNRCLCRHWCHRLQLLQFGGRLAACFLRQFQRRYLLRQLGNFVAVTFLAIVAEFALDRLQLFVEVIFALRLFHLALDAAADFLFDLQHAKLALHEGEHHFEPFGRIRLDEQRLLVGNLDRHICGNGIREPTGIVDVGKLHRGFGRQFLVELGIIVELVDNRTHQSRHLGSRCLRLGHLGHRRGQIIVSSGKVDEARATLALDQHPDGAVGKFQQLDNAGNDAKIIEVVTARVILRRVELGDQKNLLVGVHRDFERGNRFVATDEQRHDHLGEHDDVAQRQDGEGFVHPRHMG